MSPGPSERLAGGEEAARIAPPCSMFAMETPGRGEKAAPGGPKELSQAGRKVQKGTGSRGQKVGEMEMRRGMAVPSGGWAEEARREEPTATCNGGNEGNAQREPAGPSPPHQWRDSHHNQWEVGEGTHSTVARMEVELDPATRETVMTTNPDPIPEVFLKLNSTTTTGTMSTRTLWQASG